MSDPTPSSRRPGRRAKVDGPSFPTVEVDQLLVHGEVVENDDGSGTHVSYPTYREIADRYGVAFSLIGRFAKQHNCIERRKQAAADTLRRADEKVNEARAERIALTREDEIAIADKFITQFVQALDEGRVRADSVADYNTVCRLKEFLAGGADARTEMTNGMPTLEELQLRYKQNMDEWNRASEAQRELMDENIYGFDGAARQRAAKRRAAAMRQDADADSDDGEDDDDGAAGAYPDPAKRRREIN